MAHGVGYLRWHIIIWRFGGREERGLFALLCATLYLLLPATMIWILVSGWSFQYPWEFYVTVGLAASNFLLLLDVLVIALYTEASWRELLHRGQFQAHQKAATEYLSYLESHDGTLPGGAQAAILRWALFYSLFIVSIGFGLWILPLIGPATPAAFLAVDAPIVLASRRQSHVKLPIVYGRRDSTGAQLSEGILSSSRRT